MILHKLRSVAKERETDEMKQKKHKENYLQRAIARRRNFQDPVKKTSELLLPTPQISESKLEEVIKVGRAYEYARQYAEKAFKKDSPMRIFLQNIIGVTSGVVCPPPGTWRLPTKGSIS